MKIFDCFTIRDEIDTAILRMKTHASKVDYFVIAESNKTHTNKDKIFNVEKYWGRLRDFHDKIIYVKVEDSPESQNFWSNEKFQRDALARGLTKAKDGDVIAVSDLDEVVRPEAWDQIRNDSENQIWALRMPTFQFKMNYLMVSEFLPYFYCARTCAVKHSLGLTPTQIKHLRMKDNENWYRATMYDFDTQFDQLPSDSICYIEHGGWHFSNMEHLTEKMEAGADQRSQSDFTDDNIPLGIGMDESCPDRFTPVVVNSYFPEDLVTNRDDWNALLVEVADARLDSSEPFLSQTGVSFKSKSDVDLEGEENGYTIHNFA